MTIKYVICPGHVVSKSDGQSHYIGPMTLMQLYGVDPKECMIYEPAPWWTTTYFRDTIQDRTDLPHLRPSYHGKYNLP